MDRPTHWDQVYETKPSDAVSWYQAQPARSIAYVQQFATARQHVIDVGAGDCALIDELLAAGYTQLTALDVSASALARARGRLGSRADGVRWVVADVAQGPELPAAELWHDRATLHFLTSHDEQAAYARLATKTVKPGGHLVIATFALDGPQRCSGLPVQRHDGASLLRLLGDAFELVEESHEVHRTPTGAEQRFCWMVFDHR